jgi:hypothetical protein
MQIVGSPTPPQKPPHSVMIDSTFGISLIRSNRRYRNWFARCGRPKLL